MANQYYNTLTAEQKAEVDASGGPSVAWFTAAVDAGVPAAGKIAGDIYSDTESEIEGGTRVDHSDAAHWDEWMGKRKPTPRELRKWAIDQHAKYVGGDKNAQDEDYDRFSDRQLAAWIKSSWDVGKGGFFTTTGQRIGKPTETGGDGSWAKDYAPGEKFGWSEAMARGAGAGKGGGGQNKPAEPPKPVTYTEGDKGLTLTGNPLVDSMLTAFNQAQAQRKLVESGGDVDRSQLGHFARGEDQQVGGGDDLNKLAGMLMGTGGNAFLWSAVDDDAFGGLKGQWKGQEEAKKKANKVSAGPSVAAIADPTPPPVEQTAEQVVEQEPVTPRIPSYKIDQIENNFGRGGGAGDYSSPFYDMIDGNFGNNMYR
jgi:hypothetical protein